MSRFVSAGDVNGLKVINRFAGDRVFDLESVIWLSPEREVWIPFVETDALHIRPVVSASVTQNKMTGLLIRAVRDLRIIDSECVRFYDIHRIRYVDSPPTVIVQTGVPLVLECAVDVLDVTLCANRPIHGSP
jgi:hypothetical protein